MNQNKRKLRKSLIVNPQVQFAIIGHSAMVGLISVVSVQISYLNRDIDEIILPGLGLVATKYLTTLPIFALGICVLWSLKFSNRILGPLYAIEKQLEENLKGKPIEKFRTRKGDGYARLVELLNKNFKPEAIKDDQESKK